MPTIHNVARAPLGVVRGLLELVRDGKVATEEKRAEAVRQALGEAQRMHTLVNDYLGAHALESGTVPVRHPWTGGQASASGLCGASSSSGMVSAVALIVRLAQAEPAAKVISAGRAGPSVPGVAEPV